MELFVVKNECNEVVDAPFATKAEAKELRDMLAASPAPNTEEQRAKYTAWVKAERKGDKVVSPDAARKFRVAPGPDHRKWEG